MSLLTDLEPLLPSEEQTAAGRDALARELERDEPRPATASRRFTLRRGPVLAFAAALGLAAAFVIPRLGGTDVVQSARAAMVIPRGGILHVKTRYEHGPYVGLGTYWDGDPSADGNGHKAKQVGTPTGNHESWTATDPWRQRDVMFLDATGGGVATIQTAFTARAISTRSSWEDHTTRRRLTKAQADQNEKSRRYWSSHLESLAEGMGEDPVGVIQQLLQSGKLRSDGTREVNGREAVRLVGTTPGYRDSGGSWSPHVDYEFLLDAASYRPLQVTSTQVLKARPNDMDPTARKDRRIVDRWIFEVFERLPLNDQTAKLLQIDPKG